MLQQLCTLYGAIDKINQKENAVKMMDPYELAEPLARLIKKLEWGREFSHAAGHTIVNKMMVSKGITLLAQTATFNKDIIGWR